jgi:hypothetical protein
MRRCSECGTDWFMVHECEAPSDPAKAHPQSIAVVTLTDYIRELEALVRNQQDTITGLMLELTDLRIVRDERAPAARRP